MKNLQLATLPLGTNPKSLITWDFAIEKKKKHEIERRVAS